MARALITVSTRDYLALLVLVMFSETSFSESQLAAIESDAVEMIASVICTDDRLQCLSMQRDECVKHVASLGNDCLGENPLIVPKEQGDVEIFSESVTELGKCIMEEHVRTDPSDTNLREKCLDSPMQPRKDSSEATQNIFKYGLSPSLNARPPNKSLESDT